MNAPILALTDMLRKASVPADPVADAYAKFLLTVTDNKPHRITKPAASYVDLMARESCAQAICDAFIEFIGVLTDDTGERSSPSFYATDLRPMLHELINDHVTGPMGLARDRFEG